MKKLSGSLLLFIFILSSLVIFAQDSVNPTYPSGYSKSLNSPMIKDLKNVLNALGAESYYDWMAVKQRFFDGINDQLLPDLICYIRKDAPPVISLIHGGNGNVKELYGEHNIWVLIFADYDLNTKIEIKQPINDSIKIEVWKSGPFKTGIGGKDSSLTEMIKSDSVRKISWIADTIETYYTTIQLDVLEYERGPREYSISGIINALSSIVAGNWGWSSGAQAQTMQDSSQLQPLKLNKYHYNDDFLYEGLLKFKVGTNTKNRIVIKSNAKDTSSKFQYINYDFGNFEKSRVGASVGIGASFFQKFVDSTRVSPYLILNYYISRPSIPVSCTSFSAVLGTNIFKGSLFQQIIFGGRIVFDVIYPIGIILGGNWILDSDNVRRVGLFAGIDYGL